MKILPGAAFASKTAGDERPLPGIECRALSAALNIFSGKSISTQSGLGKNAKPGVK